MTKSLARVVLVLLARAAAAARVICRRCAGRLKWGQLVPPAQAVAPPKPKTFFSGAAATPGGAGRRRRRCPRAASCRSSAGSRAVTSRPSVVTEFNGKRVRIGGYVVPLDFEATTIKEFLLVPFVGACIHVPPPPANQIVYVKSDKGFRGRRAVRPGLGDGHAEDRDGVHGARRRGLHDLTPRASPPAPSDRKC